MECWEAWKLASSSPPYDHHRSLTIVVRNEPAAQDASADAPVVVRHNPSHVIQLRYMGAVQPSERATTRGIMVAFCLPMVLVGFGLWLIVGCARRRCRSRAATMRVRPVVPPKNRWRSSKPKAIPTPLAARRRVRRQTSQERFPPASRQVRHLPRARNRRQNKSSKSHSNSAWLGYRGGVTVQTSRRTAPLPKVVVRRLHRVQFN